MIKIMIMIIIIMKMVLLIMVLPERRQSLPRVQPALTPRMASMKRPPKVCVCVYIYIYR